VTKQDGSISSVSYNVVASSAGNRTDTTDEAGKQRRTCSDALGRLVEVDEPNPASQATAAQAVVTIKQATGTYDSQGTYWLKTAASAQQNLEDHGDLQGLFDPKGQYDDALGGLVGYLEPQLAENVMNELRAWANDPSTSPAEIKEAMLNILQADGVELPEPNDPHHKLREFSKNSLESAGESAVDLIGEIAPAIKNGLTMISKALDGNHQFRQSGLSSLGGAYENKNEAGSPQSSRPGTSSCVTQMSNSNPHPCDHY
jgi:hypothetical protein